jgi:hypothetical protein
MNMIKILKIITILRDVVTIKPITKTKIILYVVLNSVEPFNEFKLLFVFICLLLFRISYKYL